MSEFTTTCKRVAEVTGFLADLSSSSKTLSEAKPQLDAFNTELNEVLSPRMGKFKARVEETDESKKVYGPEMAAKVYQLLADFAILLQKFEPLYRQACEEFSTAESERCNAKLAQALSEHLKSLLEDELRCRTIICDGESAGFTTFSEVCEEDRAHVEVRRRALEKQRLAEKMKAEEEQRKQAELAAEQHRRAVEEAEARQRREREREHRRRQMEERVAMHRQLSGKTEDELLQEAIAMSLREEEERQRVRCAAQQSGSASSSASPSVALLPPQLCCEGAVASSGGPSPTLPVLIPPPPVAELADDEPEAIPKDTLGHPPAHVKPREPHSDKQPN